MSLQNGAVSLKTCSLQEFEEMCFETDFGISFSVDGGWFDLHTGADPEILKRGALYLGHHGWLTKKTFGFRWSKKDKIR